MAKVRSFLLNEEQNHFLCKLLGDIPDSIVLDFGKRFLPGGFNQVERIRARLQEKILAPGTLESWLVGLLRIVAPAVATIDTLTIKGLREVFEPLTISFGRSGLAVTMLLDTREDVHRYGAEILGRGHPTDASPEEKLDAAKKVCDFVNTHFLSAAGLTINPQAVVDKPLERECVTWPDGKQTTVDELFSKMKGMEQALKIRGEQVDYLQSCLGEQSEKQKVRLEQAQRHATHEKKRLVAEREAGRQQVAKLLKENKSLAARVAELSAVEENKIAHGVQQATTALVRKWLSAPLALEENKLAVLGGTEDLLARAELAMEAQAKQDRFSGNRLELEQRLKKLREARERLTHAAQTALRPLSQLKEVLAEVDAETARVEKVLNGRRVVDPLTERLLITINHASDWNEARHQRALVEEMVESDLVPKDDRRALYEAVERKFSLLAEAEQGRGDQEWTLRDVLFRNHPSLVLLDGHNILFGLADVFQPYFDEGRPGKRAREHLLNLLGRMVAGRDQVRVRVCFDAPQHQTVALSPNLTVEFSGGQGEHRADQCIHEHVAGRRPEELSWKYFVVSDDRAVRRDARSNGAQTVPADMLAVLLHDLGCIATATEHAA
jgi:YacP-like NYN domain